MLHVSCIPRVVQRKLQERQAAGNAYLARSPDRWLRAAAAEGLSLRQAAVLASPGKSARPHYHPSPAPQRAQQPAARQRQQGAAAAAAAGGFLRAGTPGGNRFDSFAAGEAGVEPYSARLHTGERQRLGTGRPAAAVPSAAVQVPGGGLDLAKLAADRDEYLKVSSCGVASKRFCLSCVYTGASTTGPCLGPDDAAHPSHPAMS